jgi:hypothetical protein
MASGRQERSDASVLAAAYELASLARRMATRISTGIGTTLGEEFAAHRDEVVRVLALSASIEGTILGGEVDVGVKGTRAYLSDLVPGGYYVTHYLGRDQEWSFLHGPTVAGGTVITIDYHGVGPVMTDAADLGLCPYGGGNGAWHPNVWTEKVGASTADGKAVAARVDLESESVEFEVDDGGQ